MLEVGPYIYIYIYFINTTLLSFYFASSSTQVYHVILIFQGSSQKPRSASLSSDPPTCARHAFSALLRYLLHRPCFVTVFYLGVSHPLKYKVLGSKELIIF